MNFLQQLLSRLMPPRQKYLRPIFNEPKAIAHTMDVDGLLGAMRRAEGGSPQDLFSLERDYLFDSHLLTEFGKRKMQLLKEVIDVRPQDPDDAAQVALAAALKKEIGQIPDFFDAMVHLLDATLMPVAYLQKFYKPGGKKSPFRYQFDSLETVTLATRLDYTEGRPRICKLDDDGYPLPEWSEISHLHHVEHRGHLIRNIPDCWGGPMRALIFWMLFKGGNRQFWAQNLERWNSPFIVGYYDPNTPEDKFLLEEAFAESQRLFGLVVNTGAKIDLKESKGGQADAFKQFHEVANAEISKLIAGQTMLSEAKNTGLGGGSQAVVHAGVFDDIVEFDGQNLTQTLTKWLVDPFLKINGINLPAPLICWGEIQAPDPHGPTVELLKVLPGAGLEVADVDLPEVSSRLGLKIQRASAAALPIGLSADNPTLAALRQSLRADSAPLAQLLRDSDSLEDFQRRAGGYFKGFSPAKTAAILEEAIIGIV